ncbi:MAG: SPW repeat protein [Patescibacteria group bacterium]
MKPLFISRIVVGAWLALSPWILGFSALNLAFWNNIIIGAAVILMAVWDNTNSKEDDV